MLWEEAEKGIGDGWATALSEAPLLLLASAPDRVRKRESHGTRSPHHFPL